jgi:LytS/YehU family sensor histidine kinase
MVGRLARLLRRTLQAGDEKTVPLEEELSTTRTYLELEKVRFEDRLSWQIDVGEAALRRQVPYMLVQTLVENAVKHGIGQRRAGGTIRVEATVASGPESGEASPFCLKVTNPGQLGEEAGAERGRGTGLENARERLRLRFGEEASLTPGAERPGNGRGNRSDPVAPRPRKTVFPERTASPSPCVPPARRPLPEQVAPDGRR